jgi:hypothetical protein
VPRKSVTSKASIEITVKPHAITCTGSDWHVRYFGDDNLAWKKIGGSFYSGKPVFERCESAAGGPEKAVINNDWKGKSPAPFVPNASMWLNEEWLGSLKPYETHTHEFAVLDDGSSDDIYDVYVKAQTGAPVTVKLYSGTDTTKNPIATRGAEGCAAESSVTIALLAGARRSTWCRKTPFLDHRERGLLYPAHEQPRKFSPRRAEGKDI